MKKPKTTKPATVKKIIKLRFPEESEKAEIMIKDADELYREIRIDNDLEDERGRKVKLKEGAEVDVTVEADVKDTVPKPD
jgi:predicted DNA-binding antitoxin AbrB/MazE fold protein